ncbi:hypothetical protein VTO73DRAFT_9836 [Trametes versicolor]
MAPKDIGFPGCVLSILSLSDPLAEHIFLVDVLAFPSSPPHCASSVAPPPIRRPHPALAPLLALLSLPHITKVFFDGRAGVLELLLAYGLVLANVLDLQLVEVAARAQKSKLGRIEPYLLKHFFKSISAEVERDPSAYAGIYAVRGLEHVVGFFKLASYANKPKDPAFVAMRRACGSAIWLARPLPEPLQTSAAYHITLIALVYAHFMDREWVGEHMRALRAQSAVYLGMLSSREENARLKELKILRFLPLGIIGRDGDDDDDDESVPRYACGCCLRDLTVDCYTTRLHNGDMPLEGEIQGVGDTGKAQVRERLSYCRLCNAVAQKDGRTLGEWVVC